VLIILTDIVMNIIKFMTAFRNYISSFLIGGYELMTKFEEQARSFGTKFAYEEVSSITEYRQEEDNNKPTKNFKVSKMQQ
jgi:thioredoxin reductase